MCIIYIYKHRICQALLPSTFAKHFCHHVPLVLTLPKKKHYIYIQYT